MENQNSSDTPAPPHEPGQVIGPSASAPPVSPTSSVPPVAPVPAAPLLGDRPAAVASPMPPSGVMANGQMVSFNEQQIAAPGKRFRLGKPSKKILVPLVAIMVLLGGSAAAYFGYIVPNKPSNVLAKAIQNSMLAQSFRTDGTLNITSSGVSGKVVYTAKVDNTNHIVDVNLDTTISGVEIPLELMSARGNLYFKVGDLTTLEGLISQFGSALGAPGTEQFATKLNKAVSNQWIVIDSTIIKEAKLSCLTNYPAQFSQADIQELAQSYKKDPFATITSHSEESVNGHAALKYQLALYDNKMSGYNLTSGGYFKNLNGCLKSISPSSNLSLGTVKDNDTTPLTLWVDKTSKKIVKYASQSTAFDKTQGVVSNLTGTVSYGAVNIQVPTKAKPILNLVNELGLGAYAGLVLNALGGNPGLTSPSSH